MHSGGLDDLVSLVAGTARGLFGLCQRCRGQLLRNLARALQDTARLLPDSVQGVPDRRLRRATDLQFGNDPINALDIYIDGATVVPADGARKRDITKLCRHLASQLADADVVGRLPRTGHLLIAAALLRVLVADHAISMTEDPVRYPTRVRDGAAGGWSAWHAVPMP